MPKRVLDFDALWASDKIASCPAWAQAEYAWLYGLADASGSFELTNLRVIWGRVAAVRKELTIERLEEIFREFGARGLLFTWEAGGKRYGHWTGSDVPGRLPPPSWRARLERLAPPVPKRELDAYMSRYASRRIAEGRGDLAAPGEVAASQGRGVPRESPGDGSTVAAAQAQAARLPEDGRCGEPRAATAGELKAFLKRGLEAAQGQEWNRDLNLKREEGRQHTPSGVCLPAPVEEQNGQPQSEPPGQPARARAEEFVRIYEEERGNLPPIAGLTPERRRQCGQRIRAGMSCEEFMAAVRRAAATPFLAGEGARGWRVTFDWLIANDTNVRKVNEGAYDAVASPAQAGCGGRAMDRALYSEIHVGTGPVAADYGARARPEAIERMLAREAARAGPK